MIIPEERLLYVPLTSEVPANVNEVPANVNNPIAPLLTIFLFLALWLTISVPACCIFFLTTININKGVFLQCNLLNKGSFLPVV